MSKPPHPYASTVSVARCFSGEVARRVHDIFVGRCGEEVVLTVMQEMDVI